MPIWSCKELRYSKQKSRLRYEESHLVKLENSNESEAKVTK